MPEVNSSTKPRELMFEVSYCPTLGVYHYKHAHGSEYFYDTEQLIKGMQAHMMDGNQPHAEHMAMITALGRENPHLIVSVFSDGTATPRPPEVPSLDGDDEPSTSG